MIKYGKSSVSILGKGITGIGVAQLSVMGGTALLGSFTGTIVGTVIGNVINGTMWGSFTAVEKNQNKLEAQIGISNNLQRLTKDKKEENEKGKNIDYTSC